MKKYSTLRGAFFCETCNTSTSSKFCIDCGSKCIESLTPTPSAAKKIFCTECGIPAPSVTTRFCTGCGTVLQPLSAVVPVSSTTPAATAVAAAAAAEEEKRRKQEEALAAQRAKEEEARRIQEEKMRREVAEAEARRKQEEEARAAAERVRAEEERKRQAEEVKRKQEALQASQRKTQTATTRFCIECGARSTIPTAKFCVQCGKTFDDLPSPSPSPSSAAAPHVVPPVPTAAPPPLPASASPRSPSAVVVPRVQGITGRKPATPTLRGPLRPPCRKCGAPTGPRFCTQCGEKTDEELERIRIAGGGAPPVAVTATNTAEVPRDRGHTTVLRSELADTQKELKRQAAEAARAEARANALQAQLEEAQRRSQAANGASGTLEAEAEATRALRAMLEERERELKRMQELLNPSAQPPLYTDELASTPDAPPMAPDMDFTAYTPPPPSVKTPTLRHNNAASLHDQLKTATLKKAVVVSRPKATSTADGRLRGATFLGAMQRIQAATSKDIDDDDDPDWDED